MTEPSEAALRKACEVLGWRYPRSAGFAEVILLAHHFDAEDKAAREALQCYRIALTNEPLLSFIRRHILPDPKPTVDSVVQAWWDAPGCSTEALATMLRDAGLLREDG